jgi:undecaprenyl-diphosphatase
MATHKQPTFLVLALICLVLATILALCVTVLAPDAVARLDLLLSTATRELRTPARDTIMIAVTMAGDSAVLTPLGLSIFVTALLARRYQTAAVLGGALIAATMFVPLVKQFVQRARPTALYDGAEAFSFPSGHATLSTAIYGILALTLAASLLPHHRRLVIGAMAALITAIAFSRVYLGAHWPTDVVAGMLIGGTLVFALGHLLTGPRFPPIHGGLLLVPIVVLAAVYVFHLVRDYAANTAKYSVRASIVETITNA